jgi:hypothetical protein
VVADLERQVGPRSGGAAACPDAGVTSLARPDPAAGPTVVGLGVFFQENRWGRWAFPLAMLANFAFAFLL